jgi:hypothetical protein
MNSPEVWNEFWGRNEEEDIMSVQVPERVKNQAGEEK